MKNSERNLLVLENFILHLTHSSEGDNDANETIKLTANELYQIARDYIKEDHVDGEENPYDDNDGINIIQLLNVDNEPVGLYKTKNWNEDTFQPIFDECERQAEMAQEQWAEDDLEEDEKDTAVTAFENYLSEKGFERIFAIEINTNLY